MIFRKLFSNKSYQKNKQFHSEILIRYSDYYRHLTEINKVKFLKRLNEFIVSTTFDTEKGFDINPTMKVLISCAFIKITFGLNKYTLNQYNKIFITPSSYRYEVNGHLLSGDVNTVNKRVSLSWPSVVKGFEISEDAINIAIHEFGHCLTIENFSNTFLGTFFSQKDWLKYHSIALDKIVLIKAGQSQVIRKYGGTNLMELFAVSLEAFFETPLKFIDQHPELYKSLVLLLNQDPRNQSDPVL